MPSAMTHHDESAASARPARDARKKEINAARLTAAGFAKPEAVRRIENGKLIVEGRSDDVIISGGENISLSAIEGALHKHFPHKTFAAFPVSDSQWGAALHVAVTGEGFPSQNEISDTN